MIEQKQLDMLVTSATRGPGIFENLDNSPVLLITNNTMQRWPFRMEGPLLMNRDIQDDKMMVTWINSEWPVS